MLDSAVNCRAWEPRLRKLGHPGWGCAPSGAGRLSKPLRYFSLPPNPMLHALNRCQT